MALPTRVVVVLGNRCSTRLSYAETRAMPTGATCRIQLAHGGWIRTSDLLKPTPAANPYGFRCAVFEIVGNTWPPPSGGTGPSLRVGQTEINNPHSTSGQTQHCAGELNFRTLYRTRCFYRQKTESYQRLIH